MSPRVPRSHFHSERWWGRIASRVCGIGANQHRLKAAFSAWQSGHNQSWVHGSLPCWTLGLWKGGLQWQIQRWDHNHIHSFCGFRSAFVRVSCPYTTHLWPVYVEDSAWESVWLNPTIDNGCMSPYVVAIPRPPVWKLRHFNSWTSDRYSKDVYHIIFIVHDNTEVVISIAHHKRHGSHWISIPPQQLISDAVYIFFGWEFRIFQNTDCWLRQIPQLWRDFVSYPIQQ